MFGFYHFLIHRLTKAMDQQRRYAAAWRKQSLGKQYIVLAHRDNV